MSLLLDTGTVLENLGTQGPTIAGFTGPRTGMSDRQYEVLGQLWKIRQVYELHHGDCIGADKRAHDLALEMHLPKIVIHPPSKYGYRAWCVDSPGVLILPEYPYTVRDEHIVKACDELYATPDGWQEKQRSGTWTTVRIARRLKKPLTIIYPDGSYKLERPS